MDDSKESMDTGFPARFEQFLKEFDLNTNSLATELNDKNPVKFRRWKSGEVNPSYENLRQIATKYGVSLDWLALGEGEMIRGKKTNPAPIQPMGSSTPDEMVKLRQENAILTKENEMLKAENKKVWRLALPKEAIAELDFLRSGSRPTAVSLMTRTNWVDGRVDGYVRYDEETVEDEVKIIPLNSMVDQALRILNSLAPFNAEQA